MFSRGNDFKNVQKRWDDFWKGENKRPLYSIAVPKSGRNAAPLPLYLMGFGGDYQAVADMLARWVDSREFLGEAVPVFSITFGPDDFAALCGADLEMGKSGGTSWSVHPLKTLDGAKIAFEKNGKWWGKVTEFHRVLKKTLGDSVFIAAPTLSAGLDGIVGLYGAMNLLTDLMDNPELVHNAVSRINTAYTETVKACGELFEYGKYGSANRFGMYTSGIAGVPQCDVSCMISPGMFDEFAIPGLLHEIGALDAATYHLDGPDALKHLERLAKIPGLRVIQWMPGAGEAESVDWTPLYKKILALGKGLILNGSAADVANMRREFGSKDIAFNVWGIQSRAEAEDFLDDMEKI